MDTCDQSHTHIYIIGYFNPSVRITDLVSHTTYVVYVIFIFIFILSGGTYSLKSIQHDRYFEKLFMAVLITLRVFGQKSPKK